MTAGLTGIMTEHFTLDNQARLAAELASFRDQMSATLAQYGLKLSAYSSVDPRCGGNFTSRVGIGVGHPEYVGINAEELLRAGANETITHSVFAFFHEPANHACRARELTGVKMQQVRILNSGDAGSLSFDAPSITLHRDRSSLLWMEKSPRVPGVPNLVARRTNDGSYETVQKHTPESSSWRIEPAEARERALTPMHELLSRALDGMYNKNSALHARKITAVGETVES